MSSAASLLSLFDCDLSDDFIRSVLAPVSYQESLFSLALADSLFKDATAQPFEPSFLLSSPAASSSSSTFTALNQASPAFKNDFPSQNIFAPSQVECVQDAIPACYDAGSFMSISSEREYLSSPDSQSETSDVWSSAEYTPSHTAASSPSDDSYEPSSAANSPSISRVGQRQSLKASPRLPKHRSRSRTKKQPTPEDFSSYQEYLSEWKHWRALRDSNNLSVKRSRDNKKVTKDSRKSSSKRNLQSARVHQ